MGTFQDQGSQLGIDADRAVTLAQGAAVQAQGALLAEQEHSKALQAEIDRLKALVTSPRPVTLYGVSGGPDQDVSVAITGANRVRVYTFAQLDQAVKAGRSVWASFKVGSMHGLAVRDPAAIASLVTAISVILDKPDQVVTVEHEHNNNVWKASIKDPKDPATLTAILADAAEYQAMWKCVLADVMPKVNAGRKYPLFSSDVMTSSVFQIPGGASPWWVAGTDFTGYDCYDPANWSRIVSYQVLNGRKRYAIGETGITASAVRTASAQQQIDRFVSDHDTYTKAEIVPSFVFAFNNYGAYFGDRPEVGAALKPWMALG